MKLNIAGIVKMNCRDLEILLEVVECKKDDELKRGELKEYGRSSRYCELIREEIKCRVGDGVDYKGVGGLF